MINAISAYTSTYPVNPYVNLGKVASVQASTPVTRGIPDPAQEDDAASSDSNSSLGSDTVSLSSSLLLTLQEQTGSNVFTPASSSSAYGAYTNTLDQAAEAPAASADAVSSNTSILA